MNQIPEGSYFGERALITNQPRNATVVAVGPVACLTLSREAFTETLSGDKSLLGDYPGSKRNEGEGSHESQSLLRHITQFREVLASAREQRAQGRSTRLPRALLRAMSAFAPELDESDVVERLVKVRARPLRGETQGLGHRPQAYSLP